MEFKGTKGEWVVNEYHDGDLIGIRVESDGSVIFDTGSCGYIDNEDEANAKLIACAPEMLEMLAELKNRFEHFNDKVSVFDIDQLIIKATTI